MISIQDRTAVKQQLVPIMIALGSPATAKLQAQIGEGLATIAERDFPDEWEGLVDVSYSDLILRTSSYEVGTGGEPVA